MNRTSKGTIEEAVANAVKQFHREQHGRGPTEVRTHLMGNILLVCCTGIFTPTELRLTTSAAGQRLIKSARHEWHNIVHADIETIISRIVGNKVLRSYYDLNVDANEQLEVYMLERCGESPTQGAPHHP